MRSRSSSLRDIRMVNSMLDEITLQMDRVERDIRNLREQQATHPCDEAFFHYCQHQIDKIEAQMDILNRQLEEVRR